MPFVTFNGAESLVLVDDGVINLDAQVDLYSDWKEYARFNLNFVPFFRTVAGDPISATKALGATFFITNNSLIRPFSADHELLILGNLYAEEGEDIFTPATGDVTVLGIVERAADVFQTIITVVTGSGGGGGLTALQNTILTELYIRQGLQTGTPLEIHPTGILVDAILMDIAQNQPVTGSVIVTRQ